MTSVEFSGRRRPAPAVLVVGSEQHLFDGGSGPYVRLVADANDPDVDFVLFPCGTHRKFEGVRSATLPPSLQAAIRSRRVGVIFDASTEGVAHSAERTTRLHQAIGHLGAVPRQCVYITQDRSYAREYGAHGDAEGIHARVTVLVYDSWIWRTLDAVADDGAEIFSERLVEFNARPAHRPRRFVSLNRTPRPTKIMFLLSLLRDGLWDQGYISFGGFRQPGGKSRKPRPTIEQLTAALPGFDDLLVDAAPVLDELDAHGGSLISLNAPPVRKLPTTIAVQPDALAEYGLSWFTVVTETEMRPRITRVTEKVLKPLLNFHPFFVLGNPGSLGLIRDLGFDTFGDVFDESYDDEVDVRIRFDAVYDEVVRWCRAPEEDLRRMEATVRDTVISNARWGLTELPTIGRQRHLRNVVDQLLEAVSVNGGRS